MNVHKKIRHDDEAATKVFSEGCHDSFDFGIAPGTRCNWLHVSGSGRSLKIAEVLSPFAGRRIGIEQHSNPLYPGGDLSKIVKHLGGDRGF